MICFAVLYCTVHEYRRRAKPSSAAESRVVIEGWQKLRMLTKLQRFDRWGYCQPKDHCRPTLWPFFYMSQLGELIVLFAFLPLRRFLPFIIEELMKSMLTDVKAASYISVLAHSGMDCSTKYLESVYIRVASARMVFSRCHSLQRGSSKVLMHMDINQQ